MNPGVAKSTVVLVDDMKLARVRIRQIVRSMGFSNIIEAGSAKEAWGVLQSGDIIPELILTDYNMPDMNGIQFLEKLRSIPATKETPVIFVTSESDKDLILSAVALQVTEFVVKPFTDEALLAKIKTALARKKAS